MQQEQSIVLPRFEAEDAFGIGVAIRNRLKSLSDKPAVVNIAAANNNNLLFHATSGAGVVPDNDFW